MNAFSKFEKCGICHSIYDEAQVHELRVGNTILPFVCFTVVITIAFNRTIRAGVHGVYPVNLFEGDTTLQNAHGLGPLSTVGKVFSCWIQPPWGAG